MAKKAFITDIYRTDNISEAKFFFFEVDSQSAQELLDYKSIFEEISAAYEKFPLQSISFNKVPGIFASDVEYQAPEKRGQFLTIAKNCRRDGGVHEIPDMGQPVEVDSVTMFEPSVMNVSRRGIFFCLGDREESYTIPFSLLERYLEEVEDNTRNTRRQFVS